MAVHVYENGAEGGTDGTEVNVLHFDGGNMTTGEEKDVTKIYSIRTDGETIKNVQIIGAVINQDDLTTPIQSYGDCKVERETYGIKDWMTILNGQFMAIKEIDNTNKNVKITAKVKQKDGLSDVRMKLYITPAINCIEVIG